MARLLLGPMLRYVGEQEATIWVETDGPCQVTVAAGRATGAAHTFEVAGHFYALVCITGLQTHGDPVPYLVSIDDEVAWPPPSYDFPAPVIRSLQTDRATLVFGSCRVAAPHEPPFTFAPDDEKWGFERDAVLAYALRMRTQGPDDWPDLIFWCGDQIYADELSPFMQAYVDDQRERGVDGPENEAVTFEEYTMLYRDSWSAPAVRWFLSVVPSAMIFDDHDVQDDWNTSQKYLHERRKLDWWQPKITSAFASYWVYQHAGNLSPGALDDEELWGPVGAAQRGELDRDLWPEFERFGLKADLERDQVRWSFCRDIAHSRLIVIDSRGGRQLDPDDRRMVGRPEWEWIVEHAAGECDHLFLGTSLPWLMAPALHDLEAWNEAVAEGAWGRYADRVIGEKTRQAADLEHWPAFGKSFAELSELVRARGAGEIGKAPATIVALSGDVHHAYLMQAEYPPDAGVRSAVYQAVCSPMRNPLSQREQKLFHTARTRVAEAVARALRRSAGVPDPPLRWRELDGPSFDNQIATIELEGGSATLRIEKAVGHPIDPPRLEMWMERRLGEEGSAPAANGRSAARPPARARGGSG
jgi:PhoD-like phosphatase